MTTATISDTDTQSVLAELGIKAENPGAFNGSWLDTGGELIYSVNPTTGEPIAAVRQATAEDYEKVMATTAEAFKEWRTWPAPKRGEVVRLYWPSSCASTKTPWPAW